MGLNESKRSNEHNYVNVQYELEPAVAPLLLSACSFRKVDDSFQRSPSQLRCCAKKKVLMLGLDRSGKTDLFARLTAQDKSHASHQALPYPTMGYNVETIRVRRRNLCHLKHCEVTLWDCGGHELVRSLWSYHYSNTSLLLWMMHLHDRRRLDTSLQLLSQVLTNPLLCRVPVLIVLYDASSSDRDDETKENVLTNLEVAFRFLATLSTSRASSFKWQVINVTLTERDSHSDLKKIQQCFRELMEL